MRKSDVYLAYMSKPEVTLAEHKNFIGDLSFMFGQMYYISWPNNEFTFYLAYYVIFFFVLLAFYPNLF